MGVDVINTMKEVGVEIKFPVENYAYRIAFVAKVYYDALGKYNQFLTEHSDEYEVGDWMCGDDRKDNYEKNIEGLSLDIYHLLNPVS